MLTTEERIQQYLHDKIPLSAAMGVRVKMATRERVQLSAPLAPNVNHNETVIRPQLGGGNHNETLLS